MKKDFIKATGNLDDDDDLFQLKVKDKADQEREEKNFQEWKELHPDEAKKMGMKHLDVGTDTLSSFWASNNENLSQDEKFLRRYIWDKLWLEKDNEGKYDEIDEQEDAVLDNQDNYERKYNFRFEEEYFLLFLLPFFLVFPSSFDISLFIILFILMLYSLYYLQN